MWQFYGFLIFHSEQLLYRFTTHNVISFCDFHILFHFCFRKVVFWCGYSHTAVFIKYFEYYHFVKRKQYFCFNEKLLEIIRIKSFKIRAIFENSINGTLFLMMILSLLLKQIVKRGILLQSTHEIQLNKDERNYEYMPLNSSY